MDHEAANRLATELGWQTDTVADALGCDVGGVGEGAAVGMGAAESAPSSARVVPQGIYAFAYAAGWMLLAMVASGVLRAARQPSSVGTATT